MWAKGFLQTAKTTGKLGLVFKNLDHKKVLIDA